MNEETDRKSLLMMDRRSLRAIGQNISSADIVV